MLEIKNINYKYNEKTIIRNTSYCFKKGKIYSIIGPSGVGKSTLLSLISGLEFLQEGNLLYQNEKIINYSKFRKKISYIFQEFNLISYLSAKDNITLALDIHNKKISNKEDVIENILIKLGINKNEQNKKVYELSGGQRQRVSIARAISLDENLIIADEPTGSLDRENADIVMSLFSELRQQGKCIILVTHDPVITKESDIILTLKNKQLIETPLD